MSAKSILLPAFLLLCLVAGGASNEGFVANLFLQLLATGLIVWAAWEVPTTVLSRQQRLLMGLVVAACLLIALQFLPLPYSLWEILPMRSQIAVDTASAGVTPGSVMLTLMPHESLKSAVWALPAFGMAIAMLRLAPERVAYFAWVIVGVTVLSVILSAMQMQGGGDSEWYFYERTNRGSGVGFFANSNHQATLLLTTIPFLAALMKKTRLRDPSALWAFRATGAALFAIILLGIYLNGSLAGYVLVLPVTAVSLVILFPNQTLRRLSLTALAPVVAAGVALVLMTGEGEQMLAAGTTLSPLARQVIFANSWAAIRDFFPTGSGLGSFVEIYRLYEDPSAVTATYVNHAHNDYLELLLEMGLPGGLLLVVFLAWWGWRAGRIWLAGGVDPFIRAAVIASAAILTHSIVDYPLRTAAIGAVFAMCCVLMAYRSRADWTKISSSKREPEVG